MRQDGLPPGKATELPGYLNQITDPVQMELLGNITVEILRQERRLTRTAICLKLVGRIDASHDPEEERHLRALLGMLFKRER